jgi:NTE family protein
VTTLADHLRRQPFELILSSGFFGFFAHTGVVHALEEHGLRPALVGGSSAGALVAGLWGAGLPATAIRDRLFELKRSDFWDPDPLFGVGGRRGPGLLRGDRFEALLGEALAQAGVRRFADCRLPVRVVAFDVAARRAVTLADGDLVPAIRASCSVPGMFQPAVIDFGGHPAPPSRAGDASARPGPLAGRRRLLDGGVTDRAGIGAASDGACVLYHHLPPHSPWRRFTPRQNQPPARPGLHVLCEPSLPRMSPFHLHRGREAFALARTMALRALAAPLP